MQKETLNARQAKDDWVAENLKNSMYDDDAEYYHRHSGQIFASAGINLRQWATNSSMLKENLVDENTSELLT